MAMAQKCAQIWLSKWRPYSAPLFCRTSWCFGVAAATRNKVENVAFPLGSQVHNREFPTSLRCQTDWIHPLVPLSRNVCPCLSPWKTVVWLHYIFAQKLHSRQPLGLSLFSQENIVWPFLQFPFVQSGSLESQRQRPQTILVFQWLDTMGKTTQWSATNSADRIL